jgi:hypothetical protein
MRHLNFLSAFFNLSARLLGLMSSGKKRGEYDFLILDLDFRFWIIG